MPEEPEEVLPEDRVASGLGVEEVGAQEAVEEQHDLGCGQGRQGDEDEEGDHGHHPGE